MRMSEKTFEMVNTRIYGLLIKYTEAASSGIVKTAEDQNGVEAWRQLHQRWVPKSNKKRYNIVCKILTHKKANTAFEIQNRITDLKMLQKEYNELDGDPFSLDE